MQPAYHHAVEQLGAAACLRAGVRECHLLMEELARRLAGNTGRTDELAAAVAEVETVCDLLRLIVGDGLVDLHKVASLARLQNQLRGIAHQPGATP